MSSSKCCFLTCIQISQEAGKVVWYSHLFKNFPQFFVIHTVKGFGVVNKAEVDVFLELSCFFDDLTDAGNLISGSPAFSKSSLNIWKFTVHILLKPGLANFKHYFASVWDKCRSRIEPISLASPALAGILLTYESPGKHHDHLNWCRKDWIQHFLLIENTQQTRNTKK